MRKQKLNPFAVKHLLKFRHFSKSPLRSIVVIFMLGVSAGIIYEEKTGIGTWHSYHPEPDKLNVCFTPPSGCGSLIAQQIAKSDSSIYVQAYGLTSPGIIHQLLAAHERGVKVKILLDGGNLSDNDSVYKQLRQAGIEVVFDRMPGIAHNKVIIIDKCKVITGSFNFTQAADTRNAENVLLIDDPDIALEYLRNWLSRRQQAIN